MAGIFCDQTHCVYNDGNSCFRDEIFLENKECTNYEVDFNCEECNLKETALYPSCGVLDLEGDNYCKNFTQK